MPFLQRLKGKTFAQPCLIMFASSEDRLQSLLSSQAEAAVVAKTYHAEGQYIHLEDVDSSTLHRLFYIVLHLGDHKMAVGDTIRTVQLKANTHPSSVKVLIDVRKSTWLPGAIR